MSFLAKVYMDMAENEPRKSFLAKVYMDMAENDLPKYPKMML